MFACVVCACICSYVCIVYKRRYISIGVAMCNQQEGQQKVKHGMCYMRIRTCVHVVCVNVSILNVLCYIAIHV